LRANKQFAPGGKTKTLHADQNYDEGEIEDRPEYVFKNGARYTGQWKGQDRHGKGE